MSEDHRDEGRGATSGGRTAADRAPAADETSRRRVPAGAAAARAAGVVEDGRVATDLPCPACGYELRHAATDGACPECGTPVARALDPARLVFADPDWLRATQRGLRLLAPSFVAVPVAAAIGGVLVAATGTPPLVMVALALGFLFVAAIGWQAADREPAGRLVPDPRAGLRRAQVALLAGPGIFPLYVFAMTSSARSAAGGTGLRDALLVGGVLVLLGGFPLALAAVVARAGTLLAREDPHAPPRLLRGTVLALRLAAAAFALSVFLSLPSGGTGIGPARGQGASLPVLDVLSAVAGSLALGLLVGGGITGLVLAHRTASRLRPLTGWARARAATSRSAGPA